MSILHAFGFFQGDSWWNGLKAESVGAGGSRNNASRAQLNKTPPGPIIFKYEHVGIPIYYTEKTWNSCRGPHFFRLLMEADDVDECSIPHNATIISANAIIAGLH